MPRSLAKATEQPPICEIVKVTGRGQVVRYVEFELIKMTSLISVGGNLNDSQVQFIATQLVEMFPNESLVDFKLCFERGCMGQYGEIFRMDGIVLRTWMEKYLDEKYQVIEDKLMKEKDKTPYDNIPKSEQGPGFQLAKEYVEKLLAGNKVPGMSEEEIKKNGQKDPPKKQSITSGYKYFDVGGVKILAITQEHAEELARKLIRNGDIEEI